MKNYITSEKTEVVYNPFLLRDVTLKTYNHPAYQVSFYYSKLTKKPLLIDTLETSGNHYLRSTTEVSPNMHVQIIDTLKVDATKAGYELYKSK